MIHQENFCSETTLPSHYSFLGQSNEIKKPHACSTQTSPLYFVLLASFSFPEIFDTLLFSLQNKTK
jgi:hypothetical protein